MSLVCGSDRTELHRLAPNNDEYELSHTRKEISRIQILPDIQFMLMLKQFLNRGVLDLVQLRTERLQDSFGYRGEGVAQLFRPAVIAIKFCRGDRQAPTAIL